MTAVYPGIADALQHLSVIGHCFVVTSKRSVYAERIVESLGLTAVFHGVHGTIPDGSLDDKADLIAAVARRHALDAEQTIMIGDRSHDIVGAHSNRIKAIGVLWGYGDRTELLAAGADWLATAPDQLPELTR